MTSKPSTILSSHKNTQRSITDMFGLKPPTTNNNLGNSSSNEEQKKKTIKNNNKISINSNKNKLNNNNNNSLSRISYYKLKTIEPNDYLYSLSEEFKRLLSLELDLKYGIGSSFLKVIRNQLSQDYFLNLKRFLIDEEGFKFDHNNNNNNNNNWSSGSIDDKHNCDEIYPKAKDIYSWSRITDLDKIKVVIIGQDPYHGPGQAHGLSFSVPKGIPIPGSLRNIHEELKREYPKEFKKPNHGSLISWARSGVLLLNTSLTVKKSKAGSHSNRGWERFTDSIVDAIDLYGGLSLLSNDESVNNNKKKKEEDESKEKDEDLFGKRKRKEEEEGEERNGNDFKTNDENNSNDNEKANDDRSLKRIKVNDLDNSNDFKLKNQFNHNGGFGKGVVFLCWGKWAADRVARLSDSKHLILKSAHPSPLSAHRGFLGNDHFKKANDWLESKYGSHAKIDWCDLKPE